MSLNPNAYAHLEDDSAMIQAAVDDAAQSGERVEIPRRNARTGKDIWICGGANLVQQLVSENVIDEYYISVIPVLLGDGIRLFGSMKHEIKLKLYKTRTYHGITELIYMRSLKQS